MPFTPAHAAAAWPARKVLAQLPLSALIIGTLSPDFEYFLRLAPITRWAHTPAGVVFFCIPVSIVVWLVFRRLIRPALIDLIPPGFAGGLGSPSTRGCGRSSQSRWARSPTSPGTASPISMTGQ